MSYKKNTIDSYKTSSRQETAKFILPFVFGFIVALIIWFVWLYPQYEGLELLFIITFYRFYY